MVPHHQIKVISKVRILHIAKYCYQYMSLLANKGGVQQHCQQRIVPFVTISKTLVYLMRSWIPINCFTSKTKKIHQNFTAELENCCCRCCSDKHKTCRNLLSLIFQKNFWCVWWNIWQYETNLELSVMSFQHDLQIKY